MTSDMARFENASNGAKYIGPEGILNAFLSILKHVKKDYPLVSVGSGSANIEKYLIDKCKISEIICVDPKPKSFSRGETLIEPSYGYVEELIKEKPEIVGNCILILIWADYGYSTYDYEAIHLLNPVAIFTIVELTGSAGGTLFLKWLMDGIVEAPKMKLYLHECKELNIKLPKYKSIYQHRTENSNHCHSAISLIRDDMYDKSNKEIIIKDKCKEQFNPFDVVEKSIKDGADPNLIMAQAMLMMFMTINKK